MSRKRRLQAHSQPGLEQNKATEQRSPARLSWGAGVSVSCFSTAGQDPTNDRHRILTLIQLTRSEPLSVPRGPCCWMSYRLTLSLAHSPHPGDPWESAHFRLGNLGSLRRSRGNRGLASCDCLAAAAHAELFWVSFPRVAEDDLGCGPSRRARQFRRKDMARQNGNKPESQTRDRSLNC